MSYIIILGIFIFLFFIWWANSPIYYRDVKSNDFEKYFKAFLVQSKHGSLMFIEHDVSDIFLQYAKYNAEDLKPILHFGFPDAPWSRQYFDNVLAMLQEKHISYETIKAEGAIHQFINVNMVVDNPDYTAKAAASMAINVFKIMGLDEKTNYRVKFKATVSTEAAIPALEKLSSSSNKVIRYLASRSLKKRKKGKRGTAPN